MDVYQLRVFSSVYENRSFSRASEELNLTQPAVSAHVKRLEEELGVRLFDRVGRRTLPTREADLLHERAREIISRLSDIAQDLKDSRRDVRGLVKIGASTTPGAYVVPQLAAEFRRSHPDVFFQIMIEDSESVVRKVAAGDLLIGVTSAHMENEAVDYIAQVQDELVIAAPPGLLPGTEVTQADLIGMPFLMWGEGSEMHKSMQMGHLQRGVSMRGLNVVAVLGSMDSVREAVKAGLGVSILSRFAIADELEAGRIVELVLPEIRMKQSYYFIANRRRTLSAPDQAFLDFLIGKFSAEPRPAP